MATLNQKQYEVIIGLLERELEVMGDKCSRGAKNPKAMKRAKMVESILKEIDVDDLTEIQIS